MLNHQSAITEIISDLEASGHFPGLVSAIVQLDQKNPHSESHRSGKVNPYLMWKEQCGINFPLLYLASIYLYIFAQQHQCHTFLFATRDCCHWYQIFKKIFPLAKARYIHCSRNMFGKAFRNKHTDYNNYIINTINDRGDTNLDTFYRNLEKTIYVDLHGTGQHMFSYFRRTFETVPYCFLLSTGCKNFKALPGISRKILRADSSRISSLVFDVNGGPIEMLNYDLVGTLQDYMTPVGAIRDVIEYPVDTVQPYHDCMTFIVGHLVPLQTDQIEKRYPKDVLQTLINKIFTINQDNQTVIRQVVHHVGRHKKPKANKVKKKKRSTSSRK